VAALSQQNTNRSKTLARWIEGLATTQTHRGTHWAAPPSASVGRTRVESPRSRSSRGA
jgi:hypothetical protein